MSTPTHDAPTHDELQVCAVHTDREAYLRCIRCDRLMCTDCMVRTSVGYICRECARKSDDRFFQGTNADYLVTFVITTVMSAVANTIASFFGWFIFAILIGAVAGGMIGETARRVTGRRVGRYSAQVAVAGIVAGALLMPTLLVLLRSGVLVLAPMAALQLSTIITTGVMVASVWTLFKRRI